MQNLLSGIAQMSRFHVLFVCVHYISVRQIVCENSLVLETERPCTITFLDFKDLFVGKEQASRL